MSKKEYDEEDPLLAEGRDADLQDEAKPEQTAAKDAQRQRALLISFLLMIVIGLGNKVFQKLETVPMQAYPLFQSLFTVFVYVPLSFLYIWPMMRWGSAITAEQRQVPHFSFFVMGALDSVAGTMQIFAVTYITSGSLIILLPQIAIPISMVMSYFMMGARYKWYHVVGALIVIAGLVVSVIPTLSEKDASAKHEAAWVQGVFIGVMILSCVPMTLSSIYKERALGDVEMDAVYLNGWIAIYQLLVAIPLLIPSVYAMVGSNGQRYGVQDIPNLLYWGARCYVGHNSQHGDDCSSAPLLVNVYVLFNLAYNVVIILLLKYGNANLLWLAMTIMVPLGSVAFSLNFVPGHKPLQTLAIVGLVIIMVGLILYRFWNVVEALWARRFGTLKAAFTEQGNVNLRIAANAMEGAQYLYDHHEQKKMLQKDHTQIRSGYLSRLGIPYNRGSSPSRDGFHDNVTIN